MAAPLAALGTRIEIFASGGGGRWDQTNWDGEDWSYDTWQDVTPESLTLSRTWGTDRTVGVLSVAAGGHFSVMTYDPARLLDPANTHSPWFAALRPGTPIRVTYQGLVVGTGWLDSVTYSQAGVGGRLEASDGIALLSQARILPAEMAGAPTTLRALARWIVAKCSLTIGVEPDPIDSDTGLPLPLTPVSPPPTDETTAWDWLVLAATDTLTAVWLDAASVIRFRNYGDPRDLGLTIGGADGIPLEDVQAEANSDGVWNRVQIAKPAGGVVDARDTESVARYGERMVTRDRPAPDPDAWAAGVLADRSMASIDWAPSTLRLRDAADLADLVGAGMVDMVRIAVDSASPPISVLARVLGGSLAVTWADGWSGRLAAYIPAQEWSNEQLPPEPVPPIDPTPPPTVQVVRTYACTQAARVSLTSGNAKYGAGAADQIPVGSWQGWQNRGLFAFASIPWAGVVRVVSARVLATTTTQVNVGFGSAPKWTLRRITANWSEGSASSPSGSNAVVWPGPSSTSTGSVSETCPTSQQSRFATDCTAIARAWAPASAGGSGAAYRGIAAYSAGETADKYTTEVWSEDYATAASRPVLELTLEVLA